MIHEGGGRFSLGTWDHLHSLGGPVQVKRQGGPLRNHAEPQNSSNRAVRRAQGPGGLHRPHAHLWSCPGHVGRGTTKPWILIHCDGRATASAPGLDVGKEASRTRPRFEPEQLGHRAGPPERGRVRRWSWAGRPGRQAQEW